MKKLRSKTGSSLAVFVWVVVGFIGIGETGRQMGYFGKDGSMAIKECVGTHTNDNCAHEPLDTRWFKR